MVSYARENMYILIVGAGGIGQKLTEFALNHKDDVVVIERDEDKCSEFSKKYDAVIVNADATEQETLEDAEIERADAVVTTADDATNLMVISIAQKRGVPSLVSVVNNEESKTMFREKGANVVGNPNALMAEYLYRAVKRPMIRDFMSLGGHAEIFKIVLPEGAKIAGKTLKEVKLPRRVSIIAIERNSDIIIPIEDTRLKIGDSVTVLAREDKIDKAMELFST
ncbi:MAG: TrkA family potassium uptake protein [Thermoplasmatota archaeon]